MQAECDSDERNLRSWSDLVQRDDNYEELPESKIIFKKKNNYTKSKLKDIDVTQEVKFNAEANVLGNTLFTTLNTKALEKLKSNY